MSSRERAWLDRYTIARDAYAEKLSRGRKPRRLSCRAEAERFVREFMRALGIKAEVESQWHVPRAKAHASAEWNVEPIPFDMLPEFDFTPDNPGDRLANFYVKLLNVEVTRAGKGRKTIMTSSSDGEWISLVAYTDAWHNLNADVARNIEHLPERPSLRFLVDGQVEIAGVSVLVSDKRKDDR